MGQIYRKPLGIIHHAGFLNTSYNITEWERRLETKKLKVATSIQDIMSSEIEQAIADYRDGKMLILVDDEKRENEGDLIFAASAVTPEKINFLLKFGRGLVCIAPPEDRMRELDLKPLAMHNKSRFSTNFYDMIDATEGTTTGVSAYDQSHTI